MLGRSTACRPFRRALPEAVRLGFALLLLTFGSISGATAQEISSGDLVAGEDLSDDRGWEMEDLLWQADQLAVAENHEAAAELYGRVIELAASSRQAPSGDADRDRLLRSLLGRAGANLGQGRQNDARADIESLLAIEPDYEPAGPSPSKALSSFLADVRKKTLGSLDLTLDPTDAIVRIDGRRLADPSRSHSLPAGPHTLRIERAGFDTEERSVDLRAGRRTQQKIELVRSSGAVRFAISPADSWIEIDGWRVISDEGSAACIASRADPGQVADAPSGADSTLAFCLLGGLDPGTHEIAVGRAGWRTHRFRFDVLELGDYRLPDVTLERTSAEIRIAGLPADSRILLDDEPADGATADDGEVRLAATPGDHRIEVNAGGVGVWAEEFRLEDRESLEMTAELLPSLSVAGVLGPDRVAATDLLVQVGGDIATLGDWAFLDRSAVGPDTLTRLGLRPDRLRTASGSGAADWTAVQTALDRELPASLHLVVVLSDETYSSTADLWLLAAAPGPARPVHLQIDRQGERWSPALMAALASSIETERLVMGADLADIPGHRGPTIVRVTPGGAAENAGLRAGQAVVRFGGAEVATAKDVRRRLEAASAGESLEVTADSGQVEFTTALEPRPSPVILSPQQAKGRHAILWARLRWMESQRKMEPWVALLNRAALHLAAENWSEAAAVLRVAEAPNRAGVGAGTAQYWLGLALLASENESERSAAPETLRQAAEDPEARLTHDDGPLVAPRSDRRLAEISDDNR